MPEKSESNALDLSCYTVERKIESRRNDVFLLKASKTGIKDEFLIYKKYSEPDKIEREKEMLSLLHSRGVAVPRIHGSGDGYVLLEYLDGPLFLDVFCWQENTRASVGGSLHGPSYQTIYSLCSWFKDFYAATREGGVRQLIMGDVNFRNFIVRERVYGIDLEECREGKVEEDVGSLCAFALTYSPSFSPWKMTMVGEMFRVFCGELQLDQELLKEEIKNSLLMIVQRRQMDNEAEKLQLLSFLEKNINLI
jgi:Ser/Thr protein kinase RdoA (MazF antagonist)